jgi:hypothetical protein
MQAASSKSAQQLLDEVHTLARLQQFSVDTYVRHLADELRGDDVDGERLVVIDDGLRASVDAIDRFASKSARIGLDHALIDDTVLPATFRAHLAAAVVSYGHHPDRLRERVAAIAVRTSAGASERAVEAAIAAMAAALAIREQLHAAVLALASSMATGALPAAAARARDRSLDDSSRYRWSQVWQELTAIAAAPVRIVDAPWANRCRDHDAIDLAPVIPEPTFGDLIELE